MIQFPRHSNCTLCDLHDGANHVGIPTVHMEESLAPALDTPALIILGQNPGYHEDSHPIGLPFVGPSGQLLRQVYLDAKINGKTLLERMCVYLSNAARCGPDSITREGPYNACIPYFVDDVKKIAKVHDKVYLLICAAKGVTALWKYELGEKNYTQKNSFNNQNCVVDIGGCQVTCFSTFHPAAIMRQNRLIHVVNDHLQLMCNCLDGNAPSRYVPKIDLPRYPLDSDPSIGAVDIETWGICKLNAHGEPLPEQTQFHPDRAFYVDHVTRDDLIQTVSVTLPKYKTEDHLFPVDSWKITKDLLFELKPDFSMIFRLHVPEERSMFIAWLKHLKVQMGANYGFDVLMMRAWPDFREVLDETQFLIDFMVINYLESELRPERSLKAASPLLGTHKYERTLADGGKFDDPNDPEEHLYNAEDTCVTILNIAELCRRIISNFPDTDKGTEWSLDYFSKVLWSSIRMSEAGIPLSRSKLEKIAEEARETMASTLEEAREKYDAILGGKGRNLCRTKVIADSMEAIAKEVKGDWPKQESWDEQSNLLERTKPPHKNICWSIVNRAIFSNHLPDNHDLVKIFELASKYAKAEKILTSYCVSMLDHHNRSKSSPVSDIIIPQSGYPVLADRANLKLRNQIYAKNTKEGYNPDTWLAHPKWYIVPSPWNDMSDEEGGQQQARMSVKNPAAQTFPKLIKSAYQSRWNNGRLIVFDISNAEMRAAGLISGEPSILRAYKEGIDLHDERAIQIFSLAPDFPLRDSDGERVVESQCAKHANFTDLNWGGPQVLWRTILNKSGIIASFNLCKRIIRGRAKARPVLYKWQQALVHEAEITGRIEMACTGHSRYFMPQERGRDALNETSEIVNLPIQVIAAVTLNRIKHRMMSKHLPHINTKFPSCFLWLNCYDAFFLDCRDYDTALFMKDACMESLEFVANHDYWAKMQDHYGREVPLVGDVKIMKG